MTHTYPTPTGFTSSNLAVAPTDPIAHVGKFVLWYYVDCFPYDREWRKFVVVVYCNFDAPVVDPTNPTLLTTSYTLRLGIDDVQASPFQMLFTQTANTIACEEVATITIDKPLPQLITKVNDVNGGTLEWVKGDPFVDDNYVGTYTITLTNYPFDDPPNPAYIKSSTIVLEIIPPCINT